MSILIDGSSVVMVQGLTGAQGSLHASECLAYGTHIACGVTPGKGGLKHLELPMFHTVREAKEESGANVSMIMVPAAYCKDALLEAIECDMELIVCITEGVPVHDMLLVKNKLLSSKSRMIGPNCPGIISPGLCKIGIMPGDVHQKGCVGVISRSGTLTYEVVHQTTSLGLGQSTCIGIGGDPIIGSRFIDLLPLFDADPQTRAIVLVGEIGGSGEEEAAEWIKQHATKPVIAYIAGVSAPKGRKMGHAGAIISKGIGTAENKIRVLEAAGVYVAKSPAEIGKMVFEVLNS